MQTFVTKYLISGPREMAYNPPSGDENQLKYEQYLRTVIADRPMAKPEKPIRMGEISDIGLPWQYHYDHNNWFVDRSSFYALLNRVEMLAVTGLEAKSDCQIRVNLWSYAAVTLWCNGQIAGAIETPVYKPIQKKEIELDLKAGYNELLVRLQTLGVRDTRTIFGIELIGKTEGIEVRLSSDYGEQEATDKAAEWLDSLVLEEDRLSGDGLAPEGCKLYYDEKSPDFADVGKKIPVTDISGRDVVNLEPGKAFPVVQWCHGSQCLSRRFEKLKDINPVYGISNTYEENKMDIFRKIGAVESLKRDNTFGFAIANILARKATDQVWDKDEALLYETLDQIEKRYDCSDFLAGGLVRYIKSYETDERFMTRVEEVMTGFRYWMDNDGTDAMCFWSENHGLLFYSSAMFFGQMFPDASFPKTGMTGKALEQWGRGRVIQWLEDVEEEGFEEFLASIYVTITFVALLNLVDFADEEIRTKAKKVTDGLVDMLAQHTFDGAVIAPMGRVYRDVLYPFNQGAQGILNLIDPQAPYGFSEGWLGMYATSTYTFSKDLREKMTAERYHTYTSGNARIVVNKKANYMLTSVQSPREDITFKRWTNNTLQEATVTDNHHYTKSLNERFHGTTCFEPGTYGYQQHLWYAALDCETPVFVTHPGGTSDSSSLRPGYWYGNGVMPAIRQIENCVGSIYIIPENHPVHFTHTFWPKVRFDEWVMDKGWLLGKKGDGYVGLWCSETLTAWNDQLFNCEYRAYGSEMAYYCVCGDTDHYEDLESFGKACIDLEPGYDQAHRKLTAKGYLLQYTKTHDQTQYL